MEKYTMSYQIGDKVRLINGYGVLIDGIKTITGIDNNGRYFITPTDTLWCTFKESELIGLHDEKVVRYSIWFGEIIE